MLSASHIIGQINQEVYDYCDRFSNGSDDIAVASDFFDAKSKQNALRVTMEYLQSIRAVPANYFGITVYQKWVNYDGYLDVPQPVRYYITRTLRFFYDLRNV